MMISTCTALRRLAVLLAAALLALVQVQPLQAQIFGQGSPPAVRSSVDENHVDVIRGGAVPPIQSALSIGPDDHHGLSLLIGGSGGIGSLVSAIKNVGGKTVVTIAGVSDSFAGGVSTEGNGATLTLAGGIYTYTSRDGVVAKFASNSGYPYSFYYGELGRLGSIKYPDGTSITITMKVQTLCPAGYEPTCQGPLYYVARVQGVSHSNGYMLKPTYASNSTKLTLDNIDAWGNVTNVTAVNLAVQNCSPSADTCALTGNWPKRSTVRRQRPWHIFEVVK